MIIGPSKNLWEFVESYFKSHPEQKRIKIKEDNKQWFTFYNVAQSIFRVIGFLGFGAGITGKVKELVDPAGSVLVVKTQGGKLFEIYPSRVNTTQVDEEQEVLTRLGLLLDIHEKTLDKAKPLISQKTRDLLFQSECDRLQNLDYTKQEREKHSIVGNSINTNKRLYYFMEKCQGVSLLELLQEVEAGKKVLSMLQFFHIALGCAKALLQMHQKLTIHCDLKPEHFLIFLNPDETCEVKLIDFGFSLLLSQNNEVRILTISRGTEGFVAPECYKGHFSANSDTFALGWIFKTMDAGHIIESLGKKMCVPNPTKRKPLLEIISILERHIKTLRDANEEDDLNVPEVPQEQEEFHETALSKLFSHCCTM